VIDDIHSISGKDLDVTKEGDKNGGFAHIARETTAGPAYPLACTPGDSSKSAHGSSSSLGLRPLQKRLQHEFAHPSCWPRR
jgi:hypothetical protein